PFVRECCISGDEYSSDVLAFSRTSPLPLSLLRDSATSKTWWRLPQKRVHSADYVLFDKRALAPRQR
ncbi:hypothetical protein, partial [Pseudomonas viridiflava]|uniref:hypothetical protein n=2 Tax=Pseudomonas viridiflava TaxID=33069 RepID=UPI00197EB50B